MTSSAKARQGLTSKLGQLIVDKINTLHVPQMVYGTVSAVSSTTPTCSVTLQGTSTVITGVRYGQDVVPAVGDVVYCARVGTDLFILGKIATITSAWITVGAAGAPAFGAGWSNFGSGYNPAGFRRVGDMVQLRGTVNSAGGGGTSTTIFTVPVGYRPANNCDQGILGNSIINQLVFLATGAVLCNFAPAATTYLLDNLAFSLLP